MHNHAPNSVQNIERNSIKTLNMAMLAKEKTDGIGRRALLIHTRPLRSNPVDLSKNGWTPNYIVCENQTFTIRPRGSPFDKTMFYLSHRNYKNECGCVRQSRRRHTSADQVWTLMSRSTERLYRQMLLLPTCWGQFIFPALLRTHIVLRREPATHKCLYCCQAGYFR